MNVPLKKAGECVWEVEMRPGMRVPARVYALESMLDTIRADNALDQAVNVAGLPGIVRWSLAMPDIHWGYGFPIGGVAAFDEQDGVVSPGGVGYDINCGVRLLSCGLTRDDLQSRQEQLLNDLFRTIPTGVGSSGPLVLSAKELREVAVGGAAWAVSKGYGTESDLRHIEEEGRMSGADPSRVSERAWQRGADQVGTLGSGNHFLEVGYVSEIYDPRIAGLYGLAADRVTAMIHCGSRGLGHQVCDDSLAAMDRAVRKYGIALADRQLACAPIRSPEGEAYLGAMNCAINYAFANRQVLAAMTRDVFARVFGKSSPSALRTVYEVAHNIAKFETHQVEGKDRRLCVHRKGATRAFAPGHPEVPPDYRAAGQPVLIPGDMGRCSYVLAGTAKAMQETFGSACHGAGRAMSRQKAKNMARGRNIARELEDRGILIRAHSRETLVEEMSDAYKEVTDVVEACVRAGLAVKVAQIRPLVCIKG